MLEPTHPSYQKRILAASEMLCFVQRMVRALFLQNMKRKDGLSGRAVVSSGRTVVWIPAGDGERERFPFLAGAEQQKKW